MYSTRESENSGEWLDKAKSFLASTIMLDAGAFDLLRQNHEFMSVPIIEMLAAQKDVAVKKSAEFNKRIKQNIINKVVKSEVVTPITHIAVKVFMLFTFKKTFLNPEI